MSPEEKEKNYHHLEQQLQAKQLEVNSLLEVTQAINNNLPVRSLFRIYEFILRAQINLNKLVVFVKEKTWENVICYGVDKDYKGLDVDARLSQFDVQTELTHHEDKDLNIFEIIIPVYHKEKALSYTLIGGLDQNQLISREEKTKFIQTITNIILVAIENKRLFKQQLEQQALQRELELAANVQTMLIPDHLPDDHRVTMSAIYLPHKEVGGDYYDSVWITKDELFFCIADISGKGMAAALLMANFQANIRALVRQKLSLEIFMHLLNANVNHITKGEKFITFFMAKVNFKYNTLVYVNAGHNPPIYYNKGEMQRLEKGCTILGIFDELPVIQVEEMDIHKDAFIVCYTDGLTELENKQGDYYEIDRLQDFMKRHPTRQPDEFNKILLEELDSFRGATSFGDDITILTTRLR